MRTCGWCGQSIDHMAKIAKYCCLQHKKNAASKRHRERNPGYYAQYSRSPTRLAYNEANLDRRREQSRLRMRVLRTEKPEATAQYARDWWQANKNKHYEYNRRRRAMKLAGGTGVSDTD